MEGTVSHITPTITTASSNHSWSDKQVVTKVYNGGEGQVMVKQDIYNTTIYDMYGNKQSVTTSHTIDYLI